MGKLRTCCRQESSREQCVEEWLAQYYPAYCYLDSFCPHSLLKVGFEDTVREATFAEFFGVQHRATELLLTVLMSCLWSIRAYHYYHMVYSVTKTCFTALAILAVALQLHLTYCVLKYPGFSASEYAKAHVYLADLTGCMIAVLLTANLHPAPYSSSLVVHTVHGWATGFVGFRLSTECWLHTLNLLCYVMMRLQQPGNLADFSLWGFISTSFMLLACNAVLPILVNVLYEARKRAKYVEATKSIEAIKPFWSFVLSCIPQSKIEWLCTSMSILECASTLSLFIKFYCHYLFVLAICSAYHGCSDFYQLVILFLKADLL